MSISALVMLTVFTLTQHKSDVNAQSCLQSNNGNGLPFFQNYRRQDSITVGHQAIIPTYKFKCNQMCGHITEWGVDVQPGGGGHDMEYTLDLQVWRPSPTVDDATGTGCYSLVGSNRFTSIPLAGDVARVTPSPQDYIQFQPGDVLGFYVEGGREDDNGVNILTNPSSFTLERVWYGDVDSPTSRSGSCPYSVGGDGVLDELTRAAPVISIATVTFPCPTPSMATTQPTPSPQPTTNSPPRPQEPGVDATDSPPSDADSETDPQVVTSTTGTGSQVPTTSESVGGTGRVSSGGANVGLIVGIIITVMVLIAVTVAVVIIVILVMKKHRAEMEKGQAIANIGYYSTTAGVVNTNATKKDMSDTYDYVVDDKDNGALYEDTEPYHSMGPDVSLSSMETSNGRSTLTKNGHISNIYEAPVTQRFRDTSNYYESPQTQDVFDRAGFHVPTWTERESMAGSIYEKPGCDKQQYNKLEFFVEDEIYWAPATTTSDLYSQLASRKYREIPRNQLTLLQRLGSGEFGEVCKALWSVSGATKELAIKTVKPQLPEEQKVRFLQEAAIMGQFSHPNIVKLFGVVTIGDPVMICIELLSNGDLRGYLCSTVANPSGKPSSNLEKQLLQFSKQIASGMNYLSKKSFVHRDLAARNVLLDDELNCKIADFGMARDLEDETYYTPKSKVGKIPIKWTAPEALLYKKYSTDSDVWSYGMVLFEIWSVGKKPFSQVTNSEVLKLIKSKYIQSPPPGCPKAIYKLMVDCWHPVHNKRPSFSEICSFLKTPPQQLLWWNDQDNATSQQARKLGAPLSEAKSLYQDIQNSYKDN